MQQTGKVASLPIELNLVYHGRTHAILRVIGERGIMGQKLDQL